MKALKRMKRTSASEYFSDDEKKLFLQIPHVSKVVGDIVIHDFNPDKAVRTPLMWSNLIEIKGKINAYDNQYFEYLGDAKYSEKMSYCINSTFPETVLSLIQSLNKYDSKSAKEMLDRYHDVYAKSVDVAIIENKVYGETLKVMSYLSENKIKVHDLKIDVNFLSSLSEDDLRLQIKELNAKLQPSVDIVGYNDLDYSPYLFEDIYVIEDTSADKMLICKKDGDKIAWYALDRISSFGCHDWIDGLLYDKKQLAKVNLDLINDFNLVVEFNANKITKASINLEYLNLIQGFIFDELRVNGKIIDDVPSLSFEELVINYSCQNDMWCVEERAIVKLLEEIKVVNGKLSYTDFSLVNKDFFMDKIIHEKIQEYHVNEFKEADDCGNLNRLKGLSVEHKQSINSYLDKLIERDDTEEANVFVELLHNYLNTKTPSITPKIK